MSSITPARAVRLLAALLLTSGLYASSARGDIDASGAWFVHVHFVDFDVFDGNAVEQWTQVGTSLTSQSYFGCALSGTIDPTTGDFDQSGCAGGINCVPGPNEERTGTVAADGRSFTATGSRCAETPTDCFCFQIEYTGSRCGNGVLDSGEECDDGNGDDGDGCNAACEVEQCFGCSGDPSVCSPLASGTTCDDGVACTAADQCDGAGSCAGTADCDDGVACTEDLCQPGVGCIHQLPAQTCNEASRSQLLVKDRGNDAKDVVLFKWLRGLATPLDLGDPTSTSDYRLCLYAGSASGVISEATVPAGSSRWRSLGAARFRYKDSLGGEEGIQKISLDSGTADGKIVVKGVGQSLTEPHPPLSPPVIVRMTNEETGACWGTIFDQDDVKRNEEGKFKAKAQTP